MILSLLLSILSVSFAADVVAPPVAAGTATVVVVSPASTPVEPVTNNDVSSTDPVTVPVVIEPTVVVPAAPVVPVTDAQAEAAGSSFVGALSGGQWLVAAGLLIGLVVFFVNKFRKNKAPVA